MTGNQSESPRPGRVRLSLGKRLLFGLVVTVIFFAVLELILVVAGVEPADDLDDPLLGFAKNVPHFVRETGEDGSEVVRTAPNKQKFLNDQTFAPSKAPGTVRIFCVGGSTTYGRPFFEDLSFAGYLRALLPELDPAGAYEVVNAGGISYASYRVTGVMEGLAPFEPDVFVVYTGQNEFLERRTYEGFFATPGPLREAMAWVGHTRTAALVRQVLGPRGKEEKTAVLPADPKGIPVDSVGPDAYRRDDEFRAQVLDHLRRNLNHMVDIAEAAGARIVFVTPASNLVDFSPFRSDISSELDTADRARFERLLQQGTALVAAGKTAKAVDVLRQAAALDTRHAEAHFQLATALKAEGAAEEAARHFERARDEDICPMRAISAVVETIRDVAASRGAGLVEFDRFAPRGADGFYDHVHLNLDATRMLGTRLAGKLLGRAVDEGIVRRVDERLRAARDHARDAAQLRLLVQMLVWLKEPALAMRAALEAKALDPKSADSEALLGSLVLDRDPAAAKRHYERALTLDPKSAATHFRLGHLLEKEDDLAGAAEHFAAARDSEPEFRVAWKRLAIVLMKRGRVNEAVECFERVVKLAPDDPNGHSDLGLAYARQGEPARALEEYAEALRLDPKHPTAHYNRGILNESRGEREQAIEDFRAVIEVNPGHVEARRRLLELGGKVPE